MSNHESLQLLKRNKLVMVFLMIIAVLTWHTAQSTTRRSVLAQFQADVIIEVIRDHVMRQMCWHADLALLLQNPDATDNRTGLQQRHLNDPWGRQWFIWHDRFGLILMSYGSDGAAGGADHATDIIRAAAGFKLPSCYNTLI